MLTVRWPAYDLRSATAALFGCSGLPRIERLQVVLGESYFAYMSRLPDLVLLMVEAHRYCASSGARPISELKPLLGLALTATR